VGFVTRLGYHVSLDYAPLVCPGGAATVPTVKENRQDDQKTGFGLFLLAGAEGRAVVRNIFLDGNTSKDGHSVDKKHFVGHLETGVASVWRNLELPYAHACRTGEDQTNLRFLGSRFIWRSGMR
jgi:hypothetical protein